MTKVEGIVLYNIELDGGLNGVYTNDKIPNAEIFTETAKLRAESQSAVSVIRTYDCFYFDVNNVQQICTLIFTIENNMYTAVWFINDEEVFRGQGFQMNNRQIALSYWATNQ